MKEYKENVEEKWKYKFYYRKRKSEKFYYKKLDQSCVDVVLQKEPKVQVWTLKLQDFLKKVFFTNHSTNNRGAIYENSDVQLGDLKEVRLFFHLCFILF